MSWHVKEPAAGEKCCSAGLVALPASHLGSGELEDQSIPGGCWLGLLVKQAGARRDSRCVVGCCDHLSRAPGVCMGCRPGGTCEPAVQVLACQVALLQEMGKGYECYPVTGPLAGMVQYRVVACKCPFWVPRGGRTAAGAGVCWQGVSSCLHPLHPGARLPSCLLAGLMTSAIRKWDCPAPLPGIASASLGAFRRGTRGTTRTTAPDVPRVKALQAMTLVMGSRTAPGLMSPAVWQWLGTMAGRRGFPCGQWLLLIPVLLSRHSSCKECCSS